VSLSCQPTLFGIEARLTGAQKSCLRPGFSLFSQADRCFFESVAWRCSIRHFRLVHLSACSRAAALWP